jgi:acetoin utilization protein AcuB
MSKSIPTIQRYMTSDPITIEPTASLEQAQSLMGGKSVRHLPVLEGGRLVGIITERDLALAERLSGVDPKVETVRSAMTTSVLTVSPDSPLDQVALEMAADKCGSVVVLQNQHVVGVLTTVDICRALGELLQTRLR